MGESLRILIADDNPDVLEPLAELFRMRGHAVRTAADGLAALEVAAEFHPHVGILDIDMPRMTGHEAAKHLRRQSWGRDMRLVALSGGELGRVHTHARESGFDYHMTKPADLDDLSAIVESRSGKGPG